MRPRPPGPRPSRRRRRRRGPRRTASPRSRAAGDRCPCGTRTRRPGASCGVLELEAKLGVADLDHVEVDELDVGLDPVAVQEGAVRRAHVLNVVAASAWIDAGVDT